MGFKAGLASLIRAWRKCVCNMFPEIHLAERTCIKQKVCARILVSARGIKRNLHSFNELGYFVIVFRAIQTVRLRLQFLSQQIDCIGFNVYAHVTGHKVTLSPKQPIGCDKKITVAIVPCELAFNERFENALISFASNNEATHMTQSFGFSLFNHHMIKSPHDF